MTMSASAKPIATVGQPRAIGPRSRRVQTVNTRRCDPGCSSQGSGPATAHRRQLTLRSHGTHEFTYDARVPGAGYLSLTRLLPMLSLSLFLSPLFGCFLLLPLCLSHLRQVTKSPPRDHISARPSHPLWDSPLAALARRATALRLVAAREVLKAARFGAPLGQHRLGDRLVAHKLETRLGEGGG